MGRSMGCRRKSSTEASLLKIHLSCLFEKKGGSSRKEEALSYLVEAFTNTVQHDFVKNFSFTLLHHCLKYFKKGSVKELCLACNLIGLLAFSVGCEEKTHEILEETIIPISQALKSKDSDSSKVLFVLDCLDAITLFGANNAEEKLKSLQIIWEFIQSKSESNGVVLTASISAWTFLLSTIDGQRWRVCSKAQRDSTSKYFLNLLDKDDESLHNAAVEALGVISEKEFVGSRNSSGEDQDTCFEEFSVKIDEDDVKISTWSQSVQLNFLKRFLGTGFVNHMKENEFLRPLCDFMSKEELPSGQEQQIYSDHDEEVSICFYLPEVKHKDSYKRMNKSPNSVYNKARTQLLNRRRTLSDGRNAGHFSVAYDED